MYYNHHSMNNVFQKRERNISLFVKKSYRAIILCNKIFFFHKLNLYFDFDFVKKKKIARVETFTIENLQKLRNV